MKYSVSLIILIMTCVIASAQNSPVIMTIDGQPVTRHEFETIYKKNNKDADITKEALDEYVELFVNFKLKVREAERLKMDTVKQFNTELEGYRKQLARPYLVDNQMTEDLLQEAYERMKSEVDASHILIKIPPSASPQDTLIAYKKIKDIRDRIVKGEIDFNQAAVKYSEDPSAAQNQGKLGYFTSLQMVYPFENAAYLTKIGDVSKIVRTQFGYHILTVHDKRPARGEVLIAHIMVKATDTDSKDVQEKASQKINDIYDELEGGADFGKLAAQYSDDKSSSRNGGELPWFGPGAMVREFENASFDLEANGDHTKPFKTKYGWHIAKRIDHRDLESYDSMKKSLQQRINKDVRSQMSSRSFVHKVKSEYGFKEKRKNLAAVQAIADSTLLAGGWRPGDSKKMSKWLFKINKEKYTQDDFVKFLRATQGRTNEKNVSNYVNDKYDLFTNKSVLDYEDARLEGKYPDFKALMKEYRDGILLFELTDDMVWSKAVKDSAGLQGYYDTHMDDFMYEDRVQGTVYKAKDQATAARVRNLLTQGKSNDEVEREINADSQLDLTIVSGTYEKDDQPITDLIPFKLGLSDTFEIDGNAVFMDVKEILPPSHKPFEKIKGLVTAAYQNQLEKEWIASLRERYTVTVDKDVLYSVK